MGPFVLAKPKVGILGGSFNPAHAGHLHISLEAIKRIGLDEIWWLVSPRNPLKKADDLADYKTRLDFAKHLVKGHPIRVLDLEAQHGLQYSIDTVRHLKLHYPHTQFVWLMGADNLAGFHRWRSWQAIAKLVPIAVLDRAPYALHALRGRFAQQFHTNRLSPNAAHALPAKSLPAWVYLSIPRHPLSATSLRKKLGSAAFVVHT